MRALLSWAGQWVRSSTGRQAFTPVASLTLKNDAKSLSRKGGESFLAVASFRYFYAATHLLMKNKHWLLHVILCKIWKQYAMRYTSSQVMSCRSFFSCCTALIFLHVKCDDYWRSDLNTTGLHGRVSAAVIEGRLAYICLAWVVWKNKANFVTAALLKTRDQSDESMSMSTLVYTLRTGSGLSEQTSIRLNLEKCQAAQVSGWNNFYYLFLKRNVPCKL